jgi:hypothetical protein
LRFWRVNKAKEMVQTVTLTFQVYQPADWELLLHIIQKMNGLQLIEQQASTPKKRDLKRFYGVLSHHPISLLEHDFDQMREEWNRDF